MNLYQIARIAATMVFVPFVDPSSLARAEAPVSIAAQIAAPRIERFDLDPPQSLAPGEALIFRITGSPRSTASVSIAGVKQKVALREVIAGVYEGAYTIRNDDRIDVESVVTGSLRHGNQQLSAVLGQPLVDVSALAGLR